MEGDTDLRGIDDHPLGSDANFFRDACETEQQFAWQWHDLQKECVPERDHIQLRHHAVVGEEWVTNKFAAFWGVVCCIMSRSADFFLSLKVHVVQVMCQWRIDDKVLEGCGFYLLLMFSFISFCPCAQVNFMEKISQIFPGSDLTNDLIDVDCLCLLCQCAWVTIPLGLIQWHSTAAVCACC